MSHSDQSNRAPASTVFGAWFTLLAGWACLLIWLSAKHPGRGWIAGAIVGMTLWAAFWLDYLQRKIEGRL